MNRSQTLTLIIFMLIFVVLYFGLDTKNKEQKAIEKSRAENIELINIERVKAEAKSKLPANLRVQVSNLEEQVKMSSVDEDKLGYLKSLASLWFENRHELVSSHYAEKIAEIENSEKAWSIAGTSYSIAAQRAADDRQKQYAAIKSRKALENAISIQPDKVDNKINLALSYVEVPLDGMPMKGIMMLLELNKEHPENTSVMLQLARLAIQTNQLDKAEERLQKALSIDSELNEAHCLLYEVYIKKGATAEAEKEKQLCELN